MTAPYCIYWKPFLQRVRRPSLQETDGRAAILVVARPGRFDEVVWPDLDVGTWEVRGLKRHFIHSKLMAWVAFDRALEGVEQASLISA